MYFDGKGRAEAIRMMLHIAGADWKDTRFGFKDWPAIKPTTPLGSVPVLKIGDETYCQSVALMRYTAKLAGFYPEDALEALKCDQALDTLNELMSKAPRSEDKDEMKKLREEFQATHMTKTAAFLESCIEKNGGVGFCKEPSVADVALSMVTASIESGTFDYIDAAFFKAYRGIVATCESIAKNEKIASYSKKE